MSLCLIFTHFSKQSSIDGLPDGKISKAFIISLTAPFQAQCASNPSLSDKPTKSRDKTSFVFSTETPGGSFRVLGTKRSFQTQWFQLLLFLNTQDINSSQHITLTHYVLACWHNVLRYANCPATLSSCRTGLLRPNRKRYK